MLKTLLDAGYSAYQQYKKAELEKSRHSAPASLQPAPSPASVGEERSNHTPKLKIPVSDLRFNLSQERAELQQLLRKKLADAGLPPGTQVVLQKTPIGTLAVDGNLNAAQQKKLEGLFNQSPEIKRLFTRVSQYQPTVEFVSNADRLAKTYGVNNQALEAIVSRNQEHNTLQDISLRLDELKRQMPTEREAGETQRFGLAISV